MKSLPAIDLSLLDVALRAALDGGAAILGVYDGDDFDVETKGDGSPLTRADRAAHEAITAHLGGTELPVLSEEGRDIAYAERGNWSRFWLVDPLDGTKEFIKRNGEFTVNIALISGGAPIGGVVYAPATKVLYLGAGSAGAFIVRDAEPRSAPRAVAQVMERGKRLPLPREERPYRVVGSRSHASRETAAYVESLRKEHPDLELSSIGSSLKLCLVAEGSADVYPRFAPTMEWDTAAADAVVRAAGKRVLRYDEAQGTQKALVYNKENLLNPWFLVSS